MSLRTTLLLSVAATALAVGPAAAQQHYPFISRSEFWVPYAYDPPAITLLHFDSEAEEEIEDLGLPEDPFGEPEGIDLMMPGAGARKGGGPVNANPVGPAVELGEGCRLVAEGRFAGGLRLEGPKAALVHPEQGRLSSRTVEWWMKLDRLPGGTARLLGFFGGESAKAAGEAIALELDAEGNLSVRWKDDVLSVPGAPLDPEDWTHVALAWSTAWPYENELRVHVNGHLRLRHEFPGSIGWANGYTGFALGRGMAGLVDELRYSRQVRDFYAYNLDRFADAPAEPKAPGQPLFRSSDDLIFYLPFNRTTEPERAAAGTRHDPVYLNDTDVELDPRRSRHLFPSGAEGQALRLGSGGSNPRYDGLGNLRTAEGTIAFWLHALDWDNYTRDNRFDDLQPTSMGLFSILGAYAKGSWEARFHRAGPILTVGITLHLPEGVDRPVEFHPGRWVHVAFSWEGANLTYYENGEKRSPDGGYGVSLATREGEDVNDTDPKWWLLARPEAIVFDWARYLGRAPVHTALDDFRIYSRALSAVEIANVYALHAPGEEPEPLPGVDLQVHHNGVSGDVQTRVVSLMEAFEAAHGARVRVVEISSGSEVGEGEVLLPANKTATLSVKTPPLAFAAYHVEAEVSDAEGRVLGEARQTFTREPPPWWETAAGTTDTVMPGWDPVRVDGDAVEVYGRRIVFGGIGLPASVVSAGEDILAAPPVVSVRLDGRDVPLEATPGALRLTAAGETRADLHGAGAAGALRWETDAYVELDGMMWFACTLRPHGDAPVDVERLTVEFPFRTNNAELVHWWTGQRGFRNGRAVHIGYPPAGQGEIFRSNDTNRLARLGGLRGSFLPYLMLTGMERGMAWFAENDKGWTQSMETPAVSLVREDDRLMLRLNILSEAVTVDAPRTFGFGLHPTPVKELPERWRGSPSYSNVSPDSFCGNNLKGRRGPSTFNTYPEDDWESVQRRIDGEGLTKGAAGLKSLRKRFLEGFRREHGRDPTPVEEVVPGLYLDMQWTGHHPEHTREWQEAWGLGQGDFQHYDEAFVDFCSWAWREWIEKTDRFVRGAYVDDCWPAAQSQVHGPVAYVLEDGHVQPGFQFRGYRERFKRMRRICYEQGIEPHLTSHTTHTFYIPYHSFFDLILDGEDHYSSPPSQADFIDKWPLERMRFMHNGKWGLITTWLSWHGNSLPIDNWPAWTFRQQRAYTANMALHDILWSFGGSVVKDFGLTEPGTRYLPYWDNAGLVRHDHPTLKVGAWQREGATLLLMVNVGEDRGDFEVELLPEGLGVGVAGAYRVEDVDPTLLTYFDVDVTALEKPDTADIVAADDLDIDLPEPMDLDVQDADLPLEERQAKDPDGLFRWENGRLHCPVRRHDYRLFLVQPAAVSEKP